jgi:hypothetical protein
LNAWEDLTGNKLLGIIWNEPEIKVKKKKASVCRFDIGKLFSLLLLSAFCLIAEAVLRLQVLGALLGFQENPTLRGEEEICYHRRRL